MLNNLSIIIPCYNESTEVLKKTIFDIIDSLEKADTVFEIVVVNDGSNDFSYNELHDLDPRVSFFSHEVNQGYGAALKTGIKKSEYDWIGITDADGTYPNKEFHKLIPYTENFDMVVGARGWEDISLIRKFPKQILTHFASFLADAKIPDLNSGMRIFKKETAHMFWYLFPKGFSFTSTLTIGALTNDIPVKFYPIDYYKRVGKSSINPVRDTWRFFSLVMRLSLYFNPKRFFVPLSILFFLISLLRGLRDYLLNGYLGGLTLVLFFIAFQVFFFGLLAEIINKTRKFLYNEK